MEIQEIHIKKIGEQICVPEKAGQPLIIDLIATIQDGKLEDTRINPRDAQEFSLFPDNLYSGHWEYLEKLTKFLNEVLKLRKK